MKLLVTGCSSYIGSYVVKNLLKSGHSVVGISRKDPNIKHDDFIWIEHDLTKESDDLDIKSADIMIHFAAQAWPGKPAMEYVQSNVVLTRNVVNLATRLMPKLIMYSSSINVYGQVKDRELTEKTVILNPCVYGLTKYLGEQLIMESGIPYFIMRLPGVIGIGSHGWINNVFHKLSRNDKLTVKDNPYNNLIHVKDIFDLINQYLEKEINSNFIGNICCDGISNSLHVVYRMKDFLKSKSIIKHENNENYFTISNQKLKKIYTPMSVLESIELYLNEMKESSC